MNTPEQQKQAIELIRNASADQLQQLTHIWLSSGGKPRGKGTGATQPTDPAKDDDTGEKP